MMPSKTANTITVRATAPVMDVIERLIKANDKPRAEVVLDVEILEVNRNRAEALRHQPERLHAQPDVLAGTGAAQHVGAIARARRRST